MKLDFFYLTLHIYCEDSFYKYEFRFKFVYILRENSFTSWSGLPMMLCCGYKQRSSEPERIQQRLSGNQTGVLSSLSFSTHQGPELLQTFRLETRMVNFPVEILYNSNCFSCQKGPKDPCFLEAIMLNTEERQEDAHILPETS